MREHGMWSTWSRLGAVATAVLFGLTGLGVSGDAAAQALWGGTIYGMTRAEVRKAVPEAVEVAPTEGTTLNSGEVESLAVPKVSLVNEEFRAIFYFRGDALTQVTLKKLDASTFKLEAGTFDSLVTALRAKYGAELSRDAPGGGGVASTRQVVWLSGRTNITLFMLGVGASPATLNLNYQVRVAKDADKL